MQNSITEYKKTNKEGLVSYSCIDFKCSFKKLVKLFGNPNINDNYKTSSGFRLIDSNGNLVEIYDYKATNLYSQTYPSVSEFRNLKSYAWHLAASNEKIAKDLYKYLKSKIN